MSEQALADLVQTSREQIGRLERGERQLTQKWMARIAEALNVRPSDLLHTEAMAELADEVEPVDAESLEPHIRPLLSRGLNFYRVVSNQVPLVWTAQPGEVIPVDCSERAISGIKTGDLALIDLRDPNYPRTLPFLAVRQHHAPGLFFTNRPGRNTIITLPTDDLAARVIGVMIP